MYGSVKVFLRAVNLTPYSRIKGGMVAITHRWVDFGVIEWGAICAATTATVGVGVFES